MHKLQPLLVLVVLGSAVSAHASSTVIVPVIQANPDTRKLVLDSQYFDISVAGLRDLCENVPEACRGPGVSERVEAVSTRQGAALALMVTGLVFTGGGLGVALIGASQHSQDFTLGYVGIGAATLGLVLELVALGVKPSETDVVHVVNLINRTSEKKVQMPMAASEEFRAPMVAASFGF
jgi:hypothetical protein